MSNKVAFNALAPNYDGEASVHSLECLQEQLLSAACTVTRVDEQDAAKATDNAEGAVLDKVVLEGRAKVNQRWFGQHGPSHRGCPSASGCLARQP